MTKSYESTTEPLDDYIPNWVQLLFGLKNITSVYQMVIFRLNSSDLPLEKESNEEIPFGGAQ